jgi:AraC family transcriptional regulator
MRIGWICASGRGPTVPPDKALRVLGDHGHHSSILCLLHSEPIRRWFDEELEWTDRRLEATLDLASPSIRNLILRIGYEMRRPGIATQIMTSCSLWGDRDRDISARCRDHRCSDERRTHSLAAADHRRVVADRCDAPTLAELAGLCDLSVRQLARGFRTSRGCSIGEYVARSQIGHAKRLLASDEGIKSVAYTLGFASPSNFSTAFRRATGQTPRQFRRSLHKGE